MNSLLSPHRAGTLALAAALALVAGCSSMSERQQGTAQGAGVGAVAGAIIGSATGGSAGKSAVIGGALGAVAGNLWSKHMEDKRKALAQASQGTGVEVTQTADNRLKLNVPSDVSFDTGKAAIKPNFQPILDQFASGLRNNPNAEVRIIGHTDSTGTDAINNPLSIERAASTRDYLIARGVRSNAFNIDGMGSRQPIADNNTPAGRAQNRRVEIYVGERAPQG